MKKCLLRLRYGYNVENLDKNLILNFNLLVREHNNTEGQ